MSSIIPDFTYDIFISYRQKDNRGERWVSEFVEALKTELDSTFKEEVSLYFDVNPHDGLLETHDVDASLKEKLKCVIFIPVISRTYCDPNSFAWQHEFIPFVETAQHDQFGLKISVPNGNVTSRVLPVRIHDLDSADIKLCESVLRSVLRGIDFVYRSSGVNRPLRASEVHPNDNLNKTYYPDQINKLANAIDEIIQSLKKSDYGGEEKTLAEQKSNITHGRIKKPFRRLLLSKKVIKTIAIILPVIVLLSVAFFIIQSNYLRNNEKTVAVIPFTNPNNDDNLKRFAVGSMDAIITKLQEIKSLTVRGRLSSLQYLDTKKSNDELRKELKTNYLVEISLRRTSKELKLWIGLTKTKTNKELWANIYDINEEQLMPLFTKVVQIIASNLNVNFTEGEILNIEKDLTKSPDAYVNYLSGNARLFMAMGEKFIDSLSFISAINMYDKAIESDPDFAVAYARRSIARSWGIHTKQLSTVNIEKCWADISAASRINKDLPDVEIARGFYYYYCKKDYENALQSFNAAFFTNPQDYQPLFYMAMVYRAMGDWQKLYALINRVIKLDPNEPLYLTNIGSSFDLLHKFDSAIIYHQKAIDVDPEWLASYSNKIESLINRYGNTVKAHAVLDSAIINTRLNNIDYKILLDIYDRKYDEALIEAEKSNPDDFDISGKKYLNLGKICNLLNQTENAEKYYDSALVFLDRELSKDNNNAEIHSLIGMAYAGKGNKEKAIEEGIEAVDLTIKDKNKMDECDMIVNLARIDVMLGLYDKALSYIEYSLKNPSNFSTNLLQIDPIWKPIVNRPEIRIWIQKYKN
jgi:tetratricopeptide (TPR) repeat protein